MRSRKLLSGICRASCNSFSICGVIMFLKVFLESGITQDCWGSNVNKDYVYRVFHLV